jgi:glyoxylase-like metal-dependent hydrolase (beta-lactamase superfamily II)
MTSGLIADGGEAILVDPGVLPDELARLARAARALGAEVRTLFLTHHHWDHVFATGLWPGAGTVAHRTFDGALAAAGGASAVTEAVRETYRAHGFPLRAPLAMPPPGRRLDDGASVGVGRLEGTAVHLPGHAPDAIGLLLPQEGVLFSGDMLDPVELPLPEHDLRLYLRSLERISELVARGAVSRVVPGHGFVLDSSARILEQVERDRRYLEALGAVASEAARTGEDLPGTWGLFDRVEYFGRGDPARDAEHRSNAAAALRQAKAQRGLRPL